MITKPTASGRERALFYLVILTACVLGASAFLSSAAARPAALAVIASVALLKVRLVVLDFLGMRLRPSRQRAALIAWAATVLLIALVKGFAMSTVFAN